MNLDDIKQLLELVREHKIDAPSVDEVIVRIYRTAYLTLFQPESRRYRPGTIVDAQFSIPYAVAVSILHGAPMPSHFADELIRAPALLALAGKVKGIADLDYESKYPARFPTEVTMRLKSGKTVQAFRDLPSGDPENPIYARKGRFEHEMVEKFRSLLKLQPAYAARCEEMVGKLSSLETVSDVSGLMALFTPYGRR